MDLIAVYPKLVQSEQTIKALQVSRTPPEDLYGEDEDEIYIEVYRLSGQKVFTIRIGSKHGAVGIVDVAWRDDGVILAIVTSDGTTRLVNSFSGKVVHTFSAVSSSALLRSAATSPTGKRKSTGKDTAPQKRRGVPVSIHYSTHFADPDAAKKHLETANEERGTTMDDLLSLDAEIETLLRLNPDLPREFASIDVEDYLPKLATLPGNGLGGDDVFSSRVAIDGMFHAGAGRKQGGGGALSTDLVAVAVSGGFLHLRVFDSFEVGDVDLGDVEVRMVVSHPLLDKLFVLVARRDGVEESPSKHTRSRDEKGTKTTSLQLLSVDLRFLQQSGGTLPILATKATQLHNLIRYLRQIELQLAREVKSAFELPARFLRIVDEDLQDQDGEGSSFETSAYHAMLVGEVHGKFKEWLTEVLGERGVKRWEKAVSDCLELVRRLTSENWNPAVERAAIVVSNLTGLATAADGAFGIDSRILDDLRDTVNVMAVLGEELLKDTCAETQGFGAFVKWLKREVEMAGLEDTSEKLDEMREGSDNGEVRRVFRYVTERLRNTSVRRYIKEEQAIDAVGEDDGMGFYTKFKEAKLAGKDDRFLNMKTLTNRLTEHCDRMFKQVAGRLRQNVLVEYVCDLGDGLDVSVMDARIVSRPEYAVLNIVGRRSEGNEVGLIKKTLGATPKTAASKNTSEIRDAQEILDIQIMDDAEFMVLCKAGGQVQALSYGLVDAAQPTGKHIFGKQQDDFAKTGLKPSKLEINGRNKRRTATVLDEEGRGYGVFDLDTLERT